MGHPFHDEHGSERDHTDERSELAGVDERRSRRQCTTDGDDRYEQTDCCSRCRPSGCPSLRCVVVKPEQISTGTDLAAASEYVLVEADRTRGQLPDDVGDMLLTALASYGRIPAFTEAGELRE